MAAASLQNGTDGLDGLDVRSLQNGSDGPAGVDVRIEPPGTYLLSDLEATPGVVKSGHTLASERLQRAKAVTIILKVCEYLRLPIHVASAAAIYLHRFYMRFGLPSTTNRMTPDQFPGPEVAATCVFLACKTEEVPRKLVSVVEAIMASLDKTEEGKEAFEHRDFARRFGRPLIRNYGGQVTQTYRMVIDEHEARTDRPNEKTTIAVRWRRKILHTEMRVAESAGFEFVHHHPHTFLVAAARKLGMDSVLFDATWWGLMDVLRDPILVILFPGALAGGMYQHACQHLGRSPFPSSTTDPYTTPEHDPSGTEDDWRNTFAASLEEIQEARAEIETMYRTCVQELEHIPRDLRARLPDLYRKQLDRNAMIHAHQQAQHQAHMARMQSAAAAAAPVAAAAAAAATDYGVAAPAAPMAPAAPVAPLTQVVYPGPPPMLQPPLPPGQAPPPPPPGSPPAIPVPPPMTAAGAKHGHGLDASGLEDEPQPKRLRLDRGRAHALVSPNLSLNYGDSTSANDAPPTTTDSHGPAREPPHGPNESKEKTLVSPSIPTSPRVSSPRASLDKARSPPVERPARPDWGSRASTAPGGRAFARPPADPSGSSSADHAYDAREARESREPREPREIQKIREPREPPLGLSGRAFGTAPRPTAPPERPPWNRDPRYRRDDYDSRGSSSRYPDDRSDRADRPGWYRNQSGRNNGPSRVGRRDFDASRGGAAPFGSAPNRGFAGSNGYGNRNGYNQGWRR